MPTELQLKRAAGSSRSVGKMQLPAWPKLPEKIRRIDPEGSAAYEESIRRIFNTLTDSIETLRLQLPQA